MYCIFFFFFKQKTAYEMRISDWSSDVCSSDLAEELRHLEGVLAVSFHPQREGLQALDEQAGVERGDRATGVAQQHRAGADDEGQVAEGLGPDHGVVGDVGLGAAGEPAGVRGPVEIARTEELATDGGAMTA